MSAREQTAEIGGALIKTAPPLSVSGLLVFGITVQDIVVVITGVYTLAMLAHLLWRWHHEWKAKRAAA
jgi:hypothetical protein